MEDVARGASGRFACRRCRVQLLHRSSATDLTMTRSPPVLIIGPLPLPVLILHPTDVYLLPIVSRCTVHEARIVCGRNLTCLAWIDKAVDLTLVDERSNNSCDRHLSAARETRAVTTVCISGRVCLDIAS